MKRLWGKWALGERPQWKEKEEAEDEDEQRACQKVLSTGTFIFSTRCIVCMVLVLVLVSARSLGPEGFYSFLFLVLFLQYWHCTPTTVYQ